MDRDVAADSRSHSIKEVHESKEHTIEVDRDPNHHTDNSSESLLGPTYQAKLQIVRRVYAQKKILGKKRVILEWPNEGLVKVLESEELIAMRNNGYYIGGISNNVIHGKGIAIYSLDRFYEGSFQNNCKHGQGIESLPTGVFKGNYVNNKPEGRGVFASKQGDFYDGQFRVGMKHGNGHWTSARQTYSGDWKANKPNGFGKITTPESEYQGSVFDGAKHGDGREVFLNGDVYTGEYYNGRLEGEGLYMWKNGGSSYKGRFKNGIRHGMGMWKQGGDTYSGEFANDKKNGFGKFVWASGNVYEGNFLEDMMHGQGTMRWTDGSFYKGNWLYGVQNGYGEIQQLGQPLRKGIFENNCLIHEESFSTQSLSKKIKFERLYRKDGVKEKAKEKDKVKEKEKEKLTEKDRNQRKENSQEPRDKRKSPKGRFASRLEQFDTESDYSKKMLPSNSSSIAFRSSRPLTKRRVRTFQSEGCKSSSVETPFSSQQQLNLIDWRRMRALKPL